MKQLECYAFWHHCADGDFRNGTLLIGKENETVIGNCVMKNPGSAKPLNEGIRLDGRQEFSVDATMYAVAELFQIDKYGGTVRIYNLADLRQPDYSKAKGILTLSHDIDDIDEQIPTYLGFGDMYKQSMFKERIQMFYNIARNTTGMYKERIEQNPFFHPLYLMRYGRNKKECIDIIDGFRSSLGNLGK